MNKSRYVFAQIVEFLDKDKFRHLVDKYEENRYVKHFTCRNQLLTFNLVEDEPYGTLVNTNDQRYTKDKFDWLPVFFVIEVSVLQNEVLRIL